VGEPWVEGLWRIIESMAFKNVKLWNFVAIINVPPHDLFVDVLYMYEYVEVLFYL